VVEELLAHGADIHAQMIDGATPLFITAQNGHCNLLTYLVSQGADVNLRRKVSGTAKTAHGSLDLINKKS
jgi:ankyrin repeat protein